MDSPRSLFIAPGWEKLRVLARLTQGPATGEQLQRDCQSADPGACVLVLQQQGHHIAMHRLHRIGRNGVATQVGLYVLKVSPTQRAALLADA